MQKRNILFQYFLYFLLLTIICFGVFLKESRVIADCSNGKSQILNMESQITRYDLVKEFLFTNVSNQNCSEIVFWENINKLHAINQIIKPDSSYIANHVKTLVNSDLLKTEDLLASNRCKGDFENYKLDFKECHIHWNNQLSGYNKILDREIEIASQRIKYFLISYPFGVLFLFILFYYHLTLGNSTKLEDKF